MKRLNITNLLYCSILIIVGSNVMVSDLSGEGFPYLGKNDVFLLGIITGYYIGYAYNSIYFNFEFRKILIISLSLLFSKIFL